MFAESFIAHIQHKWCLLIKNSGYTHSYFLIRQPPYSLVNFLKLTSPCNKLCWM